MKETGCITGRQPGHGRVPEQMRARVKKLSAKERNAQQKRISQIDPTDFKNKQEKNKMQCKKTINNFIDDRFKDAWLQ